MTLSRTPIQQAVCRALASVAFWVLVGVALHVGSTVIWHVQLPAWLSGSFFSRLTELRFWANPYTAMIAAAMCLPALLEIASKRLAWLWGWFFVALSLLLPGWVIAMTRAEVIRERAADRLIEGTGIFSAFAVAQLIGMYGATCALIFAGIAACNKKPTTWFVTPQLAVAATLFLIHLSGSSSSFTRFFLY